MTRSELVTAIKEDPEAAAVLLVALYTLSLSDQNLDTTMDEITEQLETFGIGGETTRT